MQASPLPSSASDSGRIIRVRPPQEVDVEPPAEISSGLFPASSEDPRRLPDSTGIALRRLVLTIVVFGGMGLLAYAGWQRLDAVAAVDAPESVRP